MKLKGPLDVSHRWVVDGITFVAEKGEVNPTPDKDQVDQTLFALGFVWSDDSPNVGKASSTVQSAPAVKP